MSKRSGKVQGSSNQRSAEAAAAMVEPAAWPVKADATTTTTDFKDFPSSLIWRYHIGMVLGATDGIIRSSM